MKKLTWTNGTKKLSELVPWAKNPMVMTDSKFEKLVGQIDEFGFTNPFIINTDNTIICGHSRRRALIQLGRVDEEVPVRIPNRKVEESEFELIAIGDNRYVGAFDAALLTAGFNPDVLLKVGFERWELGNLNNDLLGTMATFEQRTEQTLDPADSAGGITQVDLDQLKQQSEAGMPPVEPGADGAIPEEPIMAFEVSLKLGVRRNVYTMIKDLREQHGAETVSQAFTMIVEAVNRARTHADFKDIFER